VAAVPVRSPDRETTAAPPAPPPRRTRRRRIFLFSFGLALTLFVLANVLVKHYEDALMRLAAYDNQYTPAHLVDYENGPTPDVVFLGSSRTAAGFEPTVMHDYLKAASGLDVHGINLGIASGNIESSYLILKNVIRDSRKPKLIVYGLSEHELLPNLGIGHLPHTEQFLSMDDYSRHAGDGIRAKASFILNQTLPIYRDRDLLRDAFSVRFNRDDPRHKYWSAGPYHLNRPPDGFWPLQGRAPAALITAQTQIWSGVLGNYLWSPDSLRRMEDLIKLAKARGIEFALVNLPAPTAYRDLWSPGALLAYRAVVAEIGRRNDVPVLDMYAASPDLITGQAFYDMNHLNPVGAAQLTAVTAAQIIGPMLSGQRPALLGTPPPSAATGSTG
jgi:hypothetical protein